MKTYGLEKEFFIADPKGDLCTVPDSLPMDSCGWLVEIRGEPGNSIEEAVDNLIKEERSVRRKVSALNCTLLENPFLKLPKEILREALKKHRKEAPSYENYLGYENHNLEKGEQSAGIHLSIMDWEVIKIPEWDYKLYLVGSRDKSEVVVEKINQKTTEKKVCKSFDFMKYFTALDYSFAKEIDETKRVPGMYEMKPDGRVEYRSLPNIIDFEKLIDVIKRVNENMFTKKAI